MNTTQISCILTDATRSEDRIKVALCYIALGQTTVDQYEGDVHLQLSAAIRTHGSAAMALKAKNTASKFS